MPFTLRGKRSASQAMLYATDSIDQPKDLERPMVGIANVWYGGPLSLALSEEMRAYGIDPQSTRLRKQVRGQPVSIIVFQAPLSPISATDPADGNHPHVACSCNKHVLTLGTRIKDSLTKSGITGYGFGTPAVSDGISMGTFGMSYSLQSRDLIADAVETVGGGHWLDGMVTIPVSSPPAHSRGCGVREQSGLTVVGRDCASPSRTGLRQEHVRGKEKFWTPLVVRRGFADDAMFALLQARRLDGPRSLEPTRSHGCVPALPPKEVDSGRERD